MTKYAQQAKVTKKKRKVYKAKANYGPTPRTTRNEPRGSGFHKNKSKPGTAGRIEADNAIGNSNPMMNEKRKKQENSNPIAKKYGVVSSNPRPKKKYPIEPGRNNAKRGDTERARKLVLDSMKKKKKTPRKK